MKAAQKRRNCCLFISSPFLQHLFFYQTVNYEGMDRHYSTLELVKHDETARAPERDWDATVFELDGSALAPQVSKTLVRDKMLC